MHAKRCSEAEKQIGQQLPQVGAEERPTYEVLWSDNKWTTEAQLAVERGLVDEEPNSEGDSGCVGGGDVDSDGDANNGNSNDSGSDGGNKRDCFAFYPDCDSQYLIGSVRGPRRSCEARSKRPWGRGAERRKGH
jgi:hypothetical protein